MMRYVDTSSDDDNDSLEADVFGGRDDAAVGEAIAHHADHGLDVSNLSFPVRCKRCCSLLSRARRGPEPG
jgi:hypothetical protein